MRSEPNSAQKLRINRLETEDFHPITKTCMVRPCQANQGYEKKISESQGRRVQHPVGCSHYIHGELRPRSMSSQ
ncbi:hypothetical protein RRG08_011790 [Elysia crispata]|uniref:Uncharacterized protein n=1 Tax=Elysia crispata TaxID=231223 RepID=A0AAE1AU69_9GAST|nr:hypothetical protein RRG08_011790 [Elysia crispata]